MGGATDRGFHLPSFFIVGPPRTGSSWLHEVLRRHTNLPSPLKETRFFDSHFHRGLKWYRAHYEEFNHGRRIGEVAPTYFASTEARERIAALVPDAKIVCVFRNPVERVVSLYRLKRAYGMIPWNFEDALARDPELLDSSRYAANLRSWQQTFGAHNILPAVYDDLREQPQFFINMLVDFVGVPRFALTPDQHRYIHDSEAMTHPRNYDRTRTATALADWFKARRLDRVVVAFKRSPLRNLVLGGGPPFTDLSTEMSARLYALFRQEVEDLEDLLQRDLTSWKHLRAA
jgi:hypothetical protein